MKPRQLNLLKADLTNGNVSTTRLEYDQFAGFLGGWGAAIRLMWDVLKPGTQALGPGNPILICSGLISGTSAAGSSRTAVVTKFPLTGAVAMANGGLNLGDAIRHAGFDMILVEGASEKPVYLELSDGNAALRDATELWGKDIYETTEHLWSKYGPRFSIMSIGPAGENGVDISLALIDNCGTIGKGGLGAVMGSKRLKAVVAGGSLPVELLDRRRYDRAIESMNRRLAAFPNKEKHIDMGTYWKWDHWFEEGFASRNWSAVYPKSTATELFGPDIYMGKAKSSRMACVTCPLPDREVLSVKDGEYKGLVTYAGGFAGRAANYCTRCGITQYDHVLKLHDLTNRMGICCHGFTSLMDFAVQMVEDGILKPQDLGVRDLRRDFPTTLKLIEDTAARRGLGEILADGYPGFFRRFGDSLKEYAVQAKGLDMLYEPRLNRMGTKPFAMVVNPRGGHHQPGVSPSDALGATVESFRSYCNRAGVPADAQHRIFDTPFKVNIARLTRHTEEFYTVLSALGICSKAPIGLLYSMEDCADLISASLGVECNAVSVKRDAERVWNLYRLLNGREGFSRKDDVFPPKWLTPMKSENGLRPLLDYFETRELTSDDLQRMLEDYYDERGWDPATGMPSVEKISELGLAELLSK